MRQPSITIIGAGFGGLGTAVELKRAGYRDITVLEKAEGVGGVWRENTYPNAACDVPSSLYSWSFAPNPAWPHRYSRQDEILGYIERTAREYGVLDLVRTGVEVTSATYDETTAGWHLETSAGERIDTDVLVTAVGQLSRPSIPELPGLGTFQGPAFHSAEWDHSVDLRGKRVAVLGTGASAIQFVPGIQSDAANITVFQRSAPYVAPKPDREYTATHGKVFERFPRTQAFGRGLTWRITEQFNKALIDDTPLKSMVKLGWRAQLFAQVRDPELRAKLIPDYEFGCKRVLFSNDWYSTLAKPNVHVVTEPVVEVLPEGVRSGDGTVHEVDVIIYGTGFAATEFLAPMQITGSDGADLHARWKGGARAFLGICVPDFPNLFVVYGPNTNLGGSSIINMLEAAARAITTLLRHTEAEGARSVAVRPEVEERFDAEIQDRLRNSVWASCHNWYHQDGGRISTNWPGLVAEYQQRCAQIDPADFVTG
ncbi:NAD(P)/FAD-dependent oxidoreductase [Marmoricola sp. URHB0036]|uniref:flavin-containing monooxygenase n=1 Tax=Marmoricola sp. URHB0036 TaxID=1298863 RepID=UPI00040A37FC|nr:NAD(P)/FAD-dependent oxidoreductase [Marmoricola sp. URHB0036]